MPSHYSLTKKVVSKSIKFKLLWPTSPSVTSFIYCYGLCENVQRNVWDSLNEVDFTLLCISHFPVIRQWVRLLILLRFSWFRIIHLLLQLLGLTIDWCRIRLGGCFPWGTGTLVFRFTGFYKRTRYMVSHSSRCNFWVWTMLTRE